MRKKIQGEQLGLQFIPSSAILAPDEIYKQATSQMLEDLSQDRRIERKPSGVHPKEVFSWSFLFCSEVLWTPHSPPLPLRAL
jgi:hypothetical protein